MSFQSTWGRVMRKGETLLDPYSLSTIWSFCVDYWDCAGYYGVIPCTGALLDHIPGERHIYCCLLYVSCILVLWCWAANGKRCHGIITFNLFCPVPCLGSKNYICIVHSLVWLCVRMQNVLFLVRCLSKRKVIWILLLESGITSYASHFYVQLWLKYKLIGF